MIPLSLRAFKGEGEIRTEAHVGAVHPRGPLVQYLGKREMEREPAPDYSWGIGMTR